ncbi:hypothetical protein HMPREF0262_03142 [Clostridium sp. ATCC 29733]|nr:hypothetical protein HMPREF0262_03142 [Clostridium sp. ATCC 29733]
MCRAGRNGTADANRVFIKDPPLQVRQVCGHHQRNPLADKCADEKKEADV